MEAITVVRSWNPDVIKTAIEEVQGGKSVRSTAAKYGIPKSTLHAHVKGIYKKFSNNVVGRNATVSSTKDKFKHGAGIRKLFAGLLSPPKVVAAGKIKFSLTCNGLSNSEENTADSCLSNGMHVTECEEKQSAEEHDDGASSSPEQNEDTAEDNQQQQQPSILFNGLVKSPVANKESPPYYGECSLTPSKRSSADEEANKDVTAVSDGDRQSERGASDRPSDDRDEENNFENENDEHSSNTADSEVTLDSKKSPSAVTLTNGDMPFRSHAVSSSEKESPKSSCNSEAESNANCETTSESRSILDDESSKHENRNKKIDEQQQTGSSTCNSKEAAESVGETVNGIDAVKSETTATKLEIADNQSTDENKPKRDLQSQQITVIKKYASSDESSAAQHDTSDKMKNATDKKPQLVEETSIKVNGNVTTLKRPLEELSEAEHDGGISSGSEGESTAQESKRIRFDESIFEEDERERIIREFVERSSETLDGINKNCQKLQQEIGSLLEIARAKELEWNSIMRLLKLKEEMLERVLFKKRQAELNGDKPVDLEATIHKMQKNYSATEHGKGGRSETSTPISAITFGSGDRSTPVPISSGSSTAAALATVANPSLSAIQQEYFKYQTAAAAASSSLLASEPYSKLRANRPILPKPSSAIATILEQPVIGEGRQGAILDVKSIIADFRSKNPGDPQPKRGRRPTVSVATVASASAVSNLRLESPSTNASAAAVVNAPITPRYLGNTSLLSMANLALGSGSHVRTSVTSTTHQDHPVASSFLLGQDGIGASSLKQDVQQQMRSGQGIVSGSNMDTMIMPSGPISASSQHSFQEALVKFAKMNERSKDSSPSSSTSSSSSNVGGTSSSAAAAVAAIMQQQQHHHHQQQQQLMSSSQGKSSQHLPPPPPYPEVTLHPVIVPPQTTASAPPVQNSLLHGILTKSNNQQQSTQQQQNNSAAAALTGPGGNVSNSAIQHRPTTFSPTLARLLTAPERSSNRVNRNIGASGGSTSVSRIPSKSTLSEILNSKRARTEVTITPVSSSSSCNNNKPANDIIQLDEEEEPDDRLVIDESRDSNVIDTAPNVIPADQVPECQGCHKKAAQFVCAGCGNQWYCSRECQVQAWEDHSEMCSG